MLQMISEQEERTRPTPITSMEFLANSMRNLALVLGNSNRATQTRAPLAGGMMTNTPSAINAYNHPEHTPTGPKALRAPLSKRIGNGIITTSNYKNANKPKQGHEYPRTKESRRGEGAKKREWQEWRKRGEQTSKPGKKVPGSETKEIGDTGKQPTATHQGSLKNDTARISGCSDCEVDGGPTGAVPDIPKGTDTLCAVQDHSPEEEVINDDDWDWQKFVDSEAD
ncbi:hypothetical protein OPQ81_005254 [Rhizoctonia solani]|nr:hypothetical protein OPQ81_005254 [Rhizoctonia solani]